MKLKFDKDKYPKYPFFAEGMLSISNIGEGRIIPSVIIERSLAKDIDNLCKAHIDSEPGDVVTTWTQPITLFRPKELILKVKFTKPIAATFGIIFNISKHFSLIDAIVYSQALRIESGNLGDKVSHLGNPDILLEVQRTNFQDAWEKILHATIKERYKKKGVTKNKVGQLAQEHIKSMREVFNIRS